MTKPPLFLKAKHKRKNVNLCRTYDKVARLAKYLRELGLSPGDRVAVNMPNMIESAIAMLASTSIGAVWSSCATYIGPQAALV